MASPADALRSLYSGYVQTLQGVSDWLRDDLPTASPGISKWAQETGRRACRKYARQRGNLPFLTSDPTWDGMCSGYLNAINEGPTSPGSYAPLQPGGQCVTGYLLDSVQRSYNGDTGALMSEFFTTYGPLQGPLTWENIEDVDTSIINQKRVKLTYTSANIVFIKSFRIKPPLRQDYGGTTISNIRRADGLADNCGDQPSEYTPPTFSPTLPNIPLPPPTNPAPGFGNNWEVNLLPDGQINICIGGECSGGTPPDGGGGPDSGGGPGEPDGDPQETNPNDPNNPNEVSGCVEDGNILTGVQIEVTQAPPNYQGLGDIYYKSCWVWMGPNSELLDMVPDGKHIEDGQFVIPDSSDCTCFKVRANSGFRVSVQAYSRPKEE